MAQFIKRNGTLHKIKKGEPLRPVREAPKVGDQVIDGREIYQVQTGGALSIIQTCCGTNHHFRSSRTSEGGGRPF